MKKRIIALVLCLIMLMALAACGESKNDTKTETKTEPASENKSEENTAENTGTVDVLKVAYTGAMADVGPFAASALGRNVVRYSIYEYLAVFTEFGQSWDEMEWELAKNIEQIDAATYRIELYDYIVDAVGNPITASDVVFSVEGIREHGMWPRINNYLESVTAVGDYTVEIKLNSTLVGGIEYIFMMTPIISEKTYNEYQSTMNTTPISTAAYQMTGYVDGSSMTLTKNENYWQKPELAHAYAKTPANTIEYYVVNEASQATMALQSGEVDIISLVKASELGFFLNPDGSDVDGYCTSYVVASTPLELMFNMSEESDGDMFRDNKALRQAICYSINKQDIVNIAFGGYAYELYDIGQHTCGDFIDEWAEEDYYDFNLDKAKELLAEAGYADGMKDGQQATINILVSSAYSSTAQVVQANIMKLGFKVEITALDDAMFSEAIKGTDGATYDWDVAIIKQGNEGYLTGSYDNMMLQNNKGYGAKNKIVDQELEQLLLTAHDVTTHNDESIDALHDYVKDNAYAMGLVVEINVTAAREGIIPGQYPWGYSCASISTIKN